MGLVIRDVDGTQDLKAKAQDEVSGRPLGLGQWGNSSVQGRDVAAFVKMLDGRENQRV
jgi:hypothetical protein